MKKTKRIELSSFSELLKVPKKRGVSFVEREFKIINDLNGLQFAFDFEYSAIEASQNRTSLYLVCIEKGKIISIEKHECLRTAEHNFKIIIAELRGRKVEVERHSFYHATAKIKA